MIYGNIIPTPQRVDLRRIALRIAIPSTDDKGLESYVEEHFGRAQFYTIVEIEGSEIKSVTSLKSLYVEHSPGDIPRFLKENNVDVVLVNRIGRRALTFFDSMGIQVFSGYSGKIRDVIKSFLSSQL